jgi:hypothetical protein
MAQLLRESFSPQRQSKQLTMDHLTAQSLFTPLDHSDSSSDPTVEARVVSSVGIPSSRGRITMQQIEVDAPSDLPEGYELDVELDGFEHTVVVVR